MVLLFQSSANESLKKKSYMSNKDLFPGGGAPKLTLSERFGKMAQWSVDRRDIDSVKNMRITKDSDSTDFKVLYFNDLQTVRVCAKCASRAVRKCDGGCVADPRRASIGFCVARDKTAPGNICGG